MKRFVVIALAAALVIGAAVIATIAVSDDRPRPVVYGWDERSMAPKKGSIRIEARVADPGGDAPWVIRSWITRDNRQACEQLGREVKGVIGDVGLDGRFRPMKFGERTICSPRVLDRRAPIVQVATFLDDALADNPKPLRTVAWGIAGPHAREVTVDAPGGRYTAPATPWRAWLNVRSGAIKTYEMVTKVRFRDGTIRTIDYGTARRPSRHPVPGTVTVDARTPAPKGGPSYGLLAWRTENGSICSTHGRMLSPDRVGSWNPEGTFFDYPIGEGAACTFASALTREQPFAFGVTTNYLEPQLVLSGVTSPDVVKVVAEGVGPRQELKPGPHGGVLAFLGTREDGGRLRVTTVFKDGSTYEYPPMRILPWRTRAPTRHPRVTAVGPKLVPVTPRGSFTLKVSCSEQSRHRLCMSSLVVRSAKTFKQPSGLSYEVNMGHRLLRIGRGVKDRPLRLRLTPKGLMLLKRDHRVPVVVSELGAGPQKSFHVVLVQDKFSK